MDFKNNNIVSRRFKVCFQDSCGGAQVAEKEIFLCKEGGFLIPCPMCECVNGGFDIKGVDSMEQGQSKTFICQGWQDRERINKHRCLCELYLTFFE